MSEMAKTTTVYKVFLSSPSDVTTEREVAEEVIKELNLSEFYYSNIILELIKWETHVAPNVGEYPQEVINRSITDYDIFVGVFWGKYGTPTINYNSGSEEEFEIAYKNYIDNKNMQIMLYFSNASIPTSNIDPESIIKINKFKKYLSEKGVLYYQYNTIEDFKKFFRTHLLRNVKNLSDRSLTEEKKNSSNGINRIDCSQEEELGLFDYLIICEDCTKEIKNIMDRMTMAMEWVSDRFNQWSRDIAKFNKYSPNMTNRAKKRIMSEVASDLQEFVDKLNLEVYSYIESENKWSNSLQSIVKISMEIKSDSKEEVKKVISSIDSFLISVVFSKKHISQFQDSIKSFNKYSKDIIKAKKAALIILGKFINELEVTYNKALDLRTNYITYQSILT